MMISDLRELKSILEIDPRNTQEDKNLLFYLEWASSWVEELLGRQLMYKQRVEWAKGTGTSKLTLKARPVFLTPTPPAVLYDSQGNFGASSGSFNLTTAPLVYGVDYCLQRDQEDGSSRSGILLRINDYWYKPQVRSYGLLSPFIADDMGSYMITYYGGYTVDTLPAQLRMATNLLASRIRYVLPLGVELQSEGYEERSISIVTSEKDKLIDTIKPLILPFRNWRF